MPDTTAIITESSIWTHLPADLDEGPSRRAFLGLIALASDSVIEPELTTFLPRDGISLYVGRIPVLKKAGVAKLQAMEAQIPEAAARILPDENLAAIGFGCTSGSMVIGPDGVAAAVHGSRPGVPVTNPVSAALKGLRALGLKRIALITPYVDEVNERVGAFVTGQGFEVVTKGSFKQPGDYWISRVPPEAIFEAGRELGSADVDGLFISCTALRCSSVIARLEDAIGKPVVTSNQAMAWDFLRLAGCDDVVEGYGQLMTIQ
jgi:maleate isomerase